MASSPRPQGTSTPRTMQSGCVRFPCKMSRTGQPTGTECSCREQVARVWWSGTVVISQPSLFASSLATIPPVLICWHSAGLLHLPLHQRSLPLRLAHLAAQRHPPGHHARVARAGRTHGRIHLLHGRLQVVTLPILNAPPILIDSICLLLPFPFCNRFVFYH